ncbi:hypothetical protein IVA88_29895 [Bradyrhizobium sp. 149]|uniref:hypothetical protein n=1 Tax=Bradyrhizobium sp. 149 TaxID=2782624 RepID=UPI001FF8D8D2|nr:hypothetical protein [Bradyrhizobium sp. 149]MCK1655602.1 hypothetical protein [Bradyrhizobium sp. 149]
MGLRQEIRGPAGLAELGCDRHRFRNRDEANADGAYRRGSYRILGKAKEGATVGGIHIFFSLCYAVRRTD